LLVGGMYFQQTFGKQMSKSIDLSNRSEGEQSNLIFISNEQEQYFSKKILYQ